MEGGPPVAILIGPAGFLPTDVNGIVSKSAETFTADLAMALAHVSPDLIIRLVIVDSAAEILVRSDLNCSPWCPDHISHTASELVGELRRNTSASAIVDV
jgi:hypothetical protein